jgi:hypothetical protein
MSSVKQCDRCGKVIGKEEFDLPEPIMISLKESVIVEPPKWTEYPHHYIRARLVREFSSDDLDVCQECMRQIIKVILTEWCKQLSVVPVDLV